MFSSARPASNAARRIAGKLAVGLRRKAAWHRHIVTIHDTKAQFVTLDDFGALVSQDVTISRAGRHSSFVTLDREVGLAMKAALMRQIGTSLLSDPDAIPLKFYHKSLHFAHELQPYPRLMIHKALARPGPSDISAATLWLWAPVSCEITLDSTPDHEFTLASRASHDQLKEVIDELKDR